MKMENINFYKINYQINVQRDKIDQTNNLKMWPVGTNNLKKIRINK